MDEDKIVLSEDEEARLKFEAAENEKLRCSIEEDRAEQDRQEMESWRDFGDELTLKYWKELMELREQRPLTWNEMLYLKSFENHFGGREKLIEYRDRLANKS